MSTIVKNKLDLTLKICPNLYWQFISVVLKVNRKFRTSLSGGVTLHNEMRLVPLFLCPLFYFYVISNNFMKLYEFKRLHEKN